MARYTTQIQDWLFATEGGFVNHPKDPGGATNFGITERTLAAWRGIPIRNLPTSQVRNLTQEEAAKIMKRNYWDVIHGDDLPVGLDYALYDYSVNSGPGKAVKDLQRILKVAVDGVIGSETLRAINTGNTVIQIERLCFERYAFVKSLKGFKTFGKGWTTRIMGAKPGAQAGDIGVIDRAVRLASNVADIPAPQVVALGKAEPEKEKPWCKPEVLGPAGAAVGTVVGAVSDVPVLQYALVGVVVCACAVAMYYAIHRINRMDPA